MKKFLIVVLLLCLLPVGAHAREAQYTDVRELLADWHEAGVPAYVSGYWLQSEDNSKLVIGLVESEEAELQKQSILGSMADPASISFVYQTYPLSYLRAVQREIEAYMVENQVPFTGLGVNVYDNHMEITFHVDVQEEPLVQKAQAELTQRYGGAVQVIFSDLVLKPVGRPDDDVFIAAPKIQTHWMPVVFLCMAGLCMALLWLRSERQRGRLLLLQGGMTVYAVADVENAIMETAPDCPPALKKRVEESIRAI